MNSKEIKKNIYKAVIAIISAAIRLDVVFQLSGNLVQKACATKDTIDKALVSYVLGIEEIHHTDHGEFLKSILDMEQYYPENMSVLNHLNLQRPSNS